MTRIILSIVITLTLCSCIEKQEITACKRGNQIIGVPKRDAKVATVALWGLEPGQCDSLGCVICE